MIDQSHPWQASTPAEWCLLAISGDIDVATTHEVERILALPSCPGRSGHQVVLDFAGVTFMDCAGLGGLIRAKRRLGNRLWLTNVSSSVTRLLALTDLTAAFPTVSRPPPVDQLCSSCTPDPRPAPDNSVLRLDAPNAGPARSTRD